MPGQPAIHALILEVVEGETLEERLTRASLPVPEALTIARQIADALDAAHDKGIVHRDLKPANIKIRPDGVVKVLDFGLAKTVGLTGGSSFAPDRPHSPAATAYRSDDGVLFGTAAYMSPEQAQGRTVDRRADIWAFGVVLFEMLSGQRAFSGDTSMEVLSNVMNTDPDWNALPAATPVAVRSLVRRCVQKDPARRLRDIADARFQIEDIIDIRADAGVNVPARIGSNRQQRAVALMTTLVVAAGIVWSLRPAPSAGDEVRFEIATLPTSDPASLAISPDGRTLVFSAISEGTSQLWLRPLEAVAAQRLPGTEDAAQPFWSPDSQTVGFFANGQLKRIHVDGTSLQALGPAAPMGGAWSREGHDPVQSRPWQ